MDKELIYDNLMSHPDWIPILKDAIKLEHDKQLEWDEKGYGKYVGWEWHDVHAPPQVLNAMVVAKLLNITMSSRSCKLYMVNNKDLVSQVISEIENRSNEDSNNDNEKHITDDLFSDIIGYDDIKQLVLMAIKAEKQVHILFSGPPASAKTMFLMGLHRLPNSYYALAPSITEAGLSNILFMYQPKYLIIDEIDRMKWSDIGQLNSLMATGKVVETKYGKTRSIELDTRVFGAGIQINRLPADLMSRFIPIKFKPYDYKEFLEVVISVIRKEGIIEEIAKEIAEHVWNTHHNNADIRQCVYIARMVGNDYSLLKKVLSIIAKYKEFPFGATGGGLVHRHV